jgi:thioredoxin reductase
MQVALEDEVSEVIVEEKDCTVPEFAIAMGHEEKWKLHNGCTDEVSEVIVEEKDCTVPEFAIAMGHQEKWKLHNGCD